MVANEEQTSFLGLGAKEVIFLFEKLPSVAHIRWISNMCEKYDNKYDNKHDNINKSTPSSVTNKSRRGFISLNKNARWSCVINGGDK